MSDTFQCGDNTSLVGYLYDECEPAERAAIEAHIALCAACAAEVAALGSARLQLASWTPPEADLGFTITRPQAVPKAQNVSTGFWNWFGQPMPAWAQAAAACLIFAAGLSLGVLRSSTAARDVLGLVEGRGTTTSEPSSPQAIAARATESAPVATATDLAALEQRLRAEMAALRAASSASGVPQTARTAQPASTAQLLAQVRALIEESEQRQQRELALRTAQVVRDFDLQRQVDLAHIQRSFGQIEGLAGAEVREQREMLNYLLRVSEQR